MLTVSLKWSWTRWTYLLNCRGGIPVSAKSTVWWPYTCKTRAKDRLRLFCTFLISVSLWMYHRFWRKWGSTIAFHRPRFCVGVSWEEFLSYRSGWAIAWPWEARHIDSTVVRCIMSLGSKIRPGYSNWKTSWIGYEWGSEVGKGEYTWKGGMAGPG